MQDLIQIIRNKSLLLVSNPKYNILSAQFLISTYTDFKSQIKHSTLNHDKGTLAIFKATISISPKFHIELCFYKYILVYNGEYSSSASKKSNWSLSLVLN